MGKAASCEITKDLTNLVVLITGANTGIGRETARRLASMNATLILACRSEERTQPLLKELKENYPKGKFQFIQLDLGDLEQISKCTQKIKEEYQKIDILLNNAGVMMPQTKMMTKQNYELQIGTNHFGHFVFTNQLISLIKKSPAGRIINVSSRAHEELLGCKGDIHFDDINYEKNKYSPADSYAQSKLANILFTNQLQKVLDGQNCNIKCVSLHPGDIDTELQRYMHKDGSFCLRYIMKIWRLTALSPEEGAQTNIYLCLEEHDKLIKTQYYTNLKPKVPSKKAQDSKLAEEFWKFSNEEMKLYISEW